jgi:hypothetical protein
MTAKSTVFLEQMIKDGYSMLSVTMWRGLLRRVETQEGDSCEYLWRILDIGKHLDANPVSVIHTTITNNPKLKTIDEDFMKCLFLLVSSDDENDADEDIDDKPKVLDLTADESLSGSYEETSQEYNDNPTSAEAYELDGFVVEDHDSESEKPKKLKRKLKHTQISQE